MGPKFTTAFWCIVGAQVVLLLAIIGVKEITLRTGTEVILQTVPVDPRSIMQGDYVILGYEIGVPHPRGTFDWVYGEHSLGDDPRPKGKTVYVSLEKRGEVWQADRYDFHRQDAGPVAIRGTIDDQGNLDFGIGTYFVPEGTGMAVETASDVKVKAVVDQSGSAVITGLLVDGKPFDPSPDAPGGSGR